MLVKNTSDIPTFPEQEFYTRKELEQYLGVSQSKLTSDVSLGVLCYDPNHKRSLQFNHQRIRHDDAMRYAAFIAAQRKEKTTQMSCHMSATYLGITLHNLRLIVARGLMPSQKFYNKAQLDACAKALAKNKHLEVSYDFVLSKLKSHYCEIYRTNDFMTLADVSHYLGMPEKFLQDCTEVGLIPFYFQDEYMYLKEDVVYFKKEMQKVMRRKTNPKRGLYEKES